MSGAVNQYPFRPKFASQGEVKKNSYKEEGVGEKRVNKDKGPQRTGESEEAGSDSKNHTEGKGAQVSG